jgi:hypothetical protein
MNSKTWSYPGFSQWELDLMAQQHIEYMKDPKFNDKVEKARQQLAEDILDTRCKLRFNRSTAWGIALEYERMQINQALANA